MKYDFKTVEAKWQKVWEDEDTFHAEIDHSKPKFYALVEFPYPSAAGLHVGHPRSYTALDVVSRKRRKNGYNVLYPMGWDAFGLPTENFAMKNHIHPAIVTKNNVDHFRSQLKALGFSFDWDRVIDTTQEDHIYDECRYVLMDNPISPRKNVLERDHIGDDPLNQRCKQQSEDAKRFEFYMI